MKNLVSMDTWGKYQKSSWHSSYGVYPTCHLAAAYCLRIHSSIGVMKRYVIMWESARNMHKIEHFFLYNLKTDFWKDQTLFAMTLLQIYISVQNVHHPYYYLTLILWWHCALEKKNLLWAGVIDIKPHHWGCRHHHKYYSVKAERNDTLHGYFYAPSHNSFSMQQPLSGGGLHKALLSLVFIRP